MKSFLVTGGAGFIGSNIVDELVKLNHKVKVVDNFFTGKKENLTHVLDKIELIEGDIRDLDLMKKLSRGVDYILHQAAFRSVPKSVENPTLTNDINILGTLNVLLAAKEAGVKRVVYASSSSVYGEAKKFPEREDDTLSPISPYAVSKLSGEYYCRAFNATFGLETVSLRYFNVFGPRQNPESKYSTVVPAFIFRILKDLSPQVDSDGGQLRDFTFVSNVVDANLAAAITPNITGRVLNVACGKSYAVLDIINILNELLGKDIKPTFGPKRAGDVRRTLADISEIKKALNYEPRVDFKTGLKKTLMWFEQNKVELS